MTKFFKKGRKQREKEKLLITSNFSFSHSVFKSLVLQTRKNRGLSGKGLIWCKGAKPQVFNPFQKQALVFTCLKYKSFENTVGKGEIARNEQFLLFPTVFSTFLENFPPFSSH